MVDEAVPAVLNGAERVPADVVVPSPDHPGRWVGGLVGVAVSLLVAGIGLAVGDDDVGGFGTLTSLGGLVPLGLLGAPIAFVLGRAFLPNVGSTGWGGAAWIGVGVGLLAPPLGALEILVLGGAEAALRVTGGDEPITSLLTPLVLLPIAIAYSFIAVFATVPAGVLWALLVRALPDGLLRRARMPGPVARLGIRHGAVVVAFGLLAVGAAPYVEDATDDYDCLDVGTPVVAFAWLPDGDGFAALTAIEGRGPDGVVRIALDSTTAPIRQGVASAGTDVAVAPDGTIAWTERPAPADPDGIAVDLWATAPRAAPARVGTLEDGAPSGLAWYDGGWAIGSGVAIVRVGPANEDGVLQLLPIADLQSRPTDDLSATVDGTRLAWLLAEGDDQDVLSIHGGSQRRGMPLPGRVSSAELTPDGDSIVYRESLAEPTRIRSVGAPIPMPDDPPDPVLADIRWTDPTIGPDGRVAALSTRIGPGRLCVTGPSLVRTSG